MMHSELKLQSVNDSQLTTLQLKPLRISATITTETKTVVKINRITKD